MREKVKAATKWHDPVVADVRAVREALFASAGYDIREFCRRARAAQAGSGHPIVSRRSRPAAMAAVSTRALPHRRTKTG